ncbi:MAG: SDR family oxidoreductase [SAR202 cluster bacterium]|nr:SDR family oxidoreductase [SAR202 cluster bacterium]
MDLELKGKTAIVTGGSRGIGKAVAREFAREGMDVAIVARGKEALDEAASELAKETGRRILPIVADTRDDASVQAMVRQAVQAMGKVDVLVNNAARPAGQGPVPKLEEITNEMFWEDMNTKVMGYLRCAREVAPLMKKQKWGRIINISGLGARTSGSTIGSMRNIAVSAMTKNLADELGPFGITVTVVHPGLTWTERIPGLVAERAKEQGVPEAAVERQIQEGNSIKRLIDATEVAYVVAFLASPKGVSINGDAVVCGGGVGKAIYY